MWNITSILISNGRYILNYLKIQNVLLKLKCNGTILHSYIKDETELRIFNHSFLLYNCKVGYDESVYAQTHKNKGDIYIKDGINKSR